MYLAQSLRPVAYVFEILTLQFREYCDATYRWNYETFSALQSTSTPLTDGGNSVQIDT